MSTQKTLFNYGQVVATPGALALGIDLLPYLQRHVSGDWGDLDNFDKGENEYAIKQNLRIFSSYQTPAGKLWVITEADRSTTTLLLPDEY